MAAACPCSSWNHQPSANRGRLERQTQRPVILTANTDSAMLRSSMPWGGRRARTCGDALVSAAPSVDFAPPIRGPTDGLGSVCGGTSRNVRGAGAPGSIGAGSGRRSRREAPTPQARAQDGRASIPLLCSPGPVCMAPGHRLHRDRRRWWLAGPCGFRQGWGGVGTAALTQVNRPCRWRARSAQRLPVEAVTRRSGRRPEVDVDAEPWNRGKRSIAEHERQCRAFPGRHAGLVQP